MDCQEFKHPIYFDNMQAEIIIIMVMKAVGACLYEDEHLTPNSYNNCLHVGTFVLQ